jgi:hypothetical protein
MEPDRIMFDHECKFLKTLNFPLESLQVHPLMVVPVAQWIARWTSNPKVPGSSPGRDVKQLFFKFHS